MTTAEIILLVVAILLLIAGFVGYVRNKIDLVWVFILLFSACFSLLVSSLTSKEAYKKALKGNNPYEMVIHYEQKGDEYIPTDTIFVKK